MKRILPAVVVFVAVAVLMWLGAWQLQRLEWKRGLLAQIEAQKAVDANTVNLAAQIDNPASNLNRGYLEGQYMKGKDVHVGPHMQDGKIGYWIVSPLKLSNARIVLVNRGWSAVQEAPPKSGKVKVTGALRVADMNGVPIAGNAQAWRKINAGGIALALGLPDVAPMVLFADKSELIPAPVAANLRNEHRQYAIFWFTMAFVLLAGYAWFSFRGRR